MGGLCNTNNNARNYYKILITKSERDYFEDLFEEWEDNINRNLRET
jgi:hypothetical protein